MTNFATLRSPRQGSKQILRKATKTNTHTQQKQTDRLGHLTSALQQRSVLNCSLAQEAFGQADGGRRLGRPNPKPERSEDGGETQEAQEDGEESG
eukprot:CAMPEP_0177314692 /NCGR_PEP_ID=MMETSP0368-20130122/12063_1 /TAXON_ID=447022 ORGANISM="Scrippsiella hangoei-like, Strain SHHI-4" /NCGR_SAMPLE_ID=MMETSP0368 /ASSEMBLY_ACC=CAM_ASM_000363 /LENGTH=94 /DNA_ID=CAMNT_0018773845 /DNA_START=235 /DNA_END=515 /DNA_ORIENTATION=+